MSIGEKIKKLLILRSIKQVELANALGISPPRLSNYLSDRREPDIEMLSKIALYLGVDLNYFSSINFYNQDNQPNAKPKKALRERKICIIYLPWKKRRRWM